MNLYDFLPKYPTLNDTLNPYEGEDFNSAIYHKKEFYENRLDKFQEFPREPGLLTKHQRTIARYLSSHTPYDRLLLAHSMGTGKTCSIIGAIEQIRNEPNSGFDGAVIFVKGDALEENFKNELLFQCTTGHYIPSNYADRTDLSKKKAVTKEIEKFYSIQTFEKFSSELRKQYTDEGIRKKFSNKIIVIDEVHNIRQYGSETDDNAPKRKKKKDSKRYSEFYRLLHNVDNCKVVLMSGTPMKDGVEEIASIMNLLLPEEKKLPTGQRFLDEYTEGGENDGVFMIKDEKRDELKALFKGYVSFLKGESDEVSDVPKKFIGKTNIGTLKHLVVSMQGMSSFQTENYLRIFDSEFGKKKVAGDEVDDLEVADEKSAAYSKARQAALFVYPNGSSGTEGFKKYIEQVETKNANGKVTNRSYKLSSELRKALQGKDTEETIKNISKYSCIYASVIKRILNTSGNCFVYSYFIEGSGAILFGLLLGLFDFSRSNGTEVAGGLRYGILAHAFTKASTQDKILKLFNSTKNAHGDFIKVIIGGRRVSEGITFKNIAAEFILTPNWNYSETSQVIARGIRLGSHKDLIELGENPEVKIYQMVGVPKIAGDEETSLQKSIDLIMYQTSEDKDIAIRTMMRLLMECAFDCSLNFLRNYAAGAEDYSRECDYTVCKYACDGVDEKEVEFGLSDDVLDYSTFQLYYANEKMARVRKRVEELFRINPRLDMDSIEKNLGEEFTKEEIHASLMALEKESESKEKDYQTFLQLYTRTPVKTIMNNIEALFRTRTEITFDEISKLNEGSTDFEILTALQELIITNTVIYNKYALPCYLREDHNHYFLVNSLLADSKVSSSLYVENPHEIQLESFSEIVKKEYNRALPNIISKLCRKAEDKKEFAEALSVLPIRVQELFIEEAVNAKKKNDAVKAVLEIYASYIKKVGKEYVSTLLPENLRCRSTNGEWDDCGDDYQERIQKTEEEKLTKIRDNPYGIIGLHNPQKDAFCLVDIKGEKSGKEQRAQKGRDTEDKRISYTGKVCNAGGWKLHQLVEIAALRLKIPAPEDFMPDATEKELKDLIRAEDLFSNDEKDYASLIDNKMLKNMTMEELRSAVYWGTSRARSIKPICVAIKEWLQEKGLVQVDNQCGVQGKKKNAEPKGAKGAKQYRIEKLIPNKDEERFAAFSREIAAMSKQTLGMPDGYKPPITNTTWYLLLSRTSKVVGFLNVNTQNQIIGACVEKNYRKKGGGIEAMRQATEYVKEQTGITPILIVKNRDKNATKNIRTYTTLGFKEDRTDETYTYMKFEG